MASGRQGRNDDRGWTCKWQDWNYTHVILHIVITKAWSTYSEIVSWQIWRRFVKILCQNTTAYLYLQLIIFFKGPKLSLRDFQANWQSGREASFIYKTISRSPRFLIRLTAFNPMLFSPNFWLESRTVSVEAKQNRFGLEWFTLLTK